MIPGNDDHVVLILAQRTRTNLEYIDETKSQEETVNEFTQLLNSMLGMVISVREAYIKKPDLSREDVERLERLQKQTSLGSIAGNLPHQESPRLQQARSFSELIIKLRNAFAHRNFQLESGGSNQIVGVTVWNTPSGRHRKQKDRIWEAYLSEEQLRGIAYAIVEYVERKYG